jgi:hypothetical protein
MELEIIILKEGEISIIGVFGLVDLHFKVMQLLLVLLIVNLEHRLFLSGKQYVKLFKKKIEDINQIFFCHIKDMVVDSQLYKVT